MMSMDSGVKNESVRCARCGREMRGGTLERRDDKNQIIHYACPMSEK